MRARKKRLVVRDEIHGDLSFNITLKSVIDHSDFQRLRWIKQLGLADFVFPCATHTRFQHSMGASYLAGEYFESILKNWLAPPVGRDCQVDSHELLFERTQSCVEAVSFDPNSRQFWKDIAMLGGLLHDLGHGPWSHTFEALSLDQDFETDILALPKILHPHYRNKSYLLHEDISILYLNGILSDLAESKIISNRELYFFTLAVLIHKELLTGETGPALRKALESLYQESRIEGGSDFLALLAPILSGPFDVDRMDYIQRDGENCGVNIGSIEWRRIVNKVIPCLALDKKDKETVVLITNVKNQHVLDDFVFSLFQMYTQVYLHPKIVGLEALLKEVLQTADLSALKLNLELHRDLSDERWRDLLRRDYRISSVEGLLMRKKGYDFDVIPAAKDSVEGKSLERAGYRPIKPIDRPMIKETLPIYLYTRMADNSEVLHLSNWTAISPIAAQFHQVNYTPTFWVSTASGN